ncbi:MAG TPA: hypothetical protein VF532_00445 [Candidatus Angelobacter sp.]
MARKIAFGRKPTLLLAPEVGPFHFVFGSSASYGGGNTCAA